METLTRALFALELPDNGQLLYTQHFGKDLDTFEPFKKLPVETRLEIWRLSFPPPRNVNIRPGKLCQKRFFPHVGHSTRCRCTAFHIKHPVALRVNQESCCESLRHYRLLFSPLNFNAAWKVAPQAICFRPNYDLLYLEWDSMLQQTFQPFDWISELQKTNPRCFAGVETLELRQFQYESQILSCQSSLLDALESFSDLKELRMIVPNVRQRWNLWQQRRWEVRQYISNKFSELWSERFVQGQKSCQQVPKITVVPKAHNCRLN